MIAIVTGASAGLGAQFARQLHFLLTMLAEKGEDETFRFIREVVLTGKEFALT